MKSARRLTFVAALAILALLAARHRPVPPTPAPGSWSGKVVGVADGDTIDVMHDGRSERLRLWGIDCPEKSQAFGQRAKQFTSDTVFGRTVTVLPHGTDRYGRTVAEVRGPDGNSLNEALLSAGMAWWYEPYAKHEVRFQQLQERARAKRVGLWSDPHAEAPWEFRRAKRNRAPARR